MPRAAQDWAPVETTLLGDVVMARAASADLFWRVARAALERSDRGPTPHLVLSVGRSAWLDAASELLALALPRTGYMAGRLPNGSAHVRLMVSRGERAARPVDTYRADGDVALALLEALVQASQDGETAVDGRAGRLDA